jgi:hypothetical protein
MRWWTYQRERFPLLAHGPLILVFSACAVSYSALLREATPAWRAYGVAFVVCLLFFLQLRIADEFKDAEEDARWRPRGLVRLRELGWIFVGAALVQLGLALGLEPRLWWVLGIGWAYLGLMSVEFFARRWLKARPVVYLLTHMGIMPLVDLFATACDWMPAGGAPPGLGPFLAASFFNGIVIETGRKLRQPADEEEGVETYSALWGRAGGLAAWHTCQLLTLGFAVVAAARIGFRGEVAVALSAAFGVSLVLGFGYLRKGMKGKWIEAMSGVWTLVLYGMLGVVPMLTRAVGAGGGP